MRSSTRQDKLNSISLNELFTKSRVKFYRFLIIHKIDFEFERWNRNDLEKFHLFHLPNGSFNSIGSELPNKHLK